MKKLKKLTLNASCMEYSEMKVIKAGNGDGIYFACDAAQHGERCVAPFGRCKKGDHNDSVGFCRGYSKVSSYSGGHQYSAHCSCA